jgi:hypothetical protein
MSSLDLHQAPQIPGPVEDKWQQEQRAFRRLLPELLRSHRGHYVAVHDGRVVSSGVDKFVVAHDAYSRFGYIPIFVSLVTDEPTSPARIPSPRLHDSESSS